MPKLSIAIVTSTLLCFAALQAQVQPLPDAELVRWKELIRRSDALQEQGLPDSAREVLERALEVARSLEEQDLYEGITLRKIGDLHLERGEYHQAGPILTRALSLLERSAQGDDRQVAAGWYALAVYYRNIGDYVHGESAFGRAISTSQKDGDQSNRAASLFGLGLLYDETARSVESVVVLTECLGILQGQPEPDSTRISQTLTNLAIAYLHQGKFQEGEPLIHRAIRTADRGLGSGSLPAASAEHVLASLESLRGDPRSAEKRLRRVLAVFERAKGSGHRDVAAILLDLSEALQLQHRYREAEVLAGRAREISEKAVGVDHLMSAQAEGVLAKAVEGQGRYAAGEVLFRHALTTFRRAAGAEDLKTASTMADLGLLRFKQGDNEEASSLYAEAMRIEQRVVPDSPKFAGVLLEYANVLRHQKQKRPADEMKKKAQLILDGFRRNNAIRAVDVTELK